MKTFALLACLFTVAFAQNNWWDRYNNRRSKNIVQLASQTKDLSTLVTALKAGKLVKALEGKGPFTVFAPTNEAFGKIPKATLTELLEPKNIKALDSVLEYHVVSGAAVYSKDLKPENNVKTLEGHNLLVEARRGHVTINHKAKVTTADVKASNGVVHIIDTVLIPPPAETAPSKNIVELAVGTKDLSTLVAALKAGKLVSALQGKGPFTVFAPTNDAFAKLPKKTLSMLLDPKNIKQLDSILEYHVVSGAAVFSKDLKAKQSVKTLQGENLSVQKRWGRVTINGKARVTTADVAASNGVVHIINAVLVPSKINGKPAAQVLHPCTLENMPNDLQYQYAFEFQSLDKNNDGFLNPSEFMSKGDEMTKTFQKNAQQNKNAASVLDRLRGGRQLRSSRSGSSLWNTLRNKFKQKWNARREAYRAAAVFSKFDGDHDKQISLCEFQNAMYDANGKDDEVFGNGDGVVVVHG